MTELANNSRADGAMPNGSTELANVSETTDEPRIEETEFADGEQPEGEQPAAETEEVEYEGKKYRIPQELKDAVLRQADYTRKTQEIADQRRSLEERQTSFQQQERLAQEFIGEVARVTALNDQIREFEKVNWDQLTAQDVTTAQRLWMQYQQTIQQRNNNISQLQTKVQQRGFEAQRATAKQIEEAHAAVARDVKDWTPESFGKAREFAVGKYGFKADELAAVSDPRVLKALRDAYVGAQAITKLAAIDKAAVSETTKPLPQVGQRTTANSRRTTDASGDGLSVEEWMRREDARLKSRR